ncbi:amino acid adenylation domain-containing protein [Streptomyces sp. NPDC020681]|uniref:amino acid adenylation domain-containing protein n=1 Tax=Streptomyces sp. NPDC020681 TaxID=3365083 RepID=UPI003789C36A
MKLTPEKQRLLQNLRAARQGGGATVPPQHRPDELRPRTSSGPVPLSPAQQGLWLVDQLLTGADRATYNMGWALRLCGTLDAGALRKALSEIVRRHEVLRTRFAAADPLPVQIVEEPGPVVLTVRDIAAEQVRDAAAAHVAAPFDLAAGPLLRPLLLRVDDDHILVLSCHHTVGDGTSIGVFHDELTALYTAYAAGRPSPLPEVRIQYADYALWQRARLDSGAHEGDLAYWRDRLAGSPALLELPTDRPRPAVASHTGGQCRFTLDPVTTRRLRELARAERSTPFMVLMAAYQVLLARWSGQGDVSVGTPVSGRGHSELDGLIGYFVNTVVLRGRTTPEMSFREVLADTRKATLEAFAHQDVPFEQLVEALAPQRTLSHHPLFQTMLVFQSDSAAEPVRLPGVESEDYPVATFDAKFDLVLDLLERPDTLEGTLGYRGDLFDPQTIERLAARYVQLLAAVAADPDARTGELDLLLPGEAQRLLAQGRGAPTDGAATTLHALFEEQARSTPHAPALSCDGVNLTYAELDERATRLADGLRARGIGPEHLVAVALERSADTVVALLAVLKAGGAYLPVDLAHPPERIAAVLEDAQPTLVLTSVDLRAQAATDQGRPSGAAAPLTAAGPHNPAYVIHTSGSTGRPKGVVVEHASAVNLVRWAVAELGAERLARTVCTTSFTFDVSVFELFAPLACGGRVEILRDALALAEREPHAARATLVSAVPSALTAVLEQGRLPQGTGTVVLAGEALPGPLVDAALAAAPGARVVNAYGPTEATVYATAWSTDQASRTAPWTGPPPIGRPLPGTTAQVLDPYLRPVPAGAAGELYLGGAGVARGYLHQPALTADRFRPDPYGEPGARMYRTGDLVRRTDDGELQYLGRTDHQVKVRGFRIEPGEIEAALCAHEQVAQAVVVAREDIPGDKRLVAYVVAPAATPAPPAAALRGHLGRILPAHMVPGSIVELERLPLTANGKLDRAALPAPDLADAATRAPYEPPRPGTEQLIATIWSELLRVERIGRHDNFFDLGGHSLHAATAIARLRTRTGTELPLPAVFAAPTVAELAADADARRTAPARETIRSLDRSRYRITPASRS